MRTLTVSASPLPGMVASWAGLPWQAAVILFVLGLAAATALAWRTETNRQDRYLRWIELVDKKVRQGQDIDLNGVLENALAPPRQVAGPARQRRTRRGGRAVGKAGGS
jgi:hypothetical protein